MCNVYSVDEIRTRVLGRCYIKRPTTPGYFVIQLYCYRCGEELDGEQKWREESWGTVSAFLECANCDFYLSGKNALVEVEAAWLEFGRA